jgi:hypothetical protein
MITGHYDRFDPTKEYESHLFRAGYVLQSAELNEIQTALSTRMKGIGDALFKDGDVVRDARCIVDANTGIVRCESGAIYLRGAVRGVPPATFTVATTGVVAVGIYLVTTAVTELDDPALRDPAGLTRNYQEPGAGRKKVSAKWGFAGDGQAGDFFPVYTIEDGNLNAKEPPPNMDAITQALARYDRDSAGGTYVVSGLTVQRMDDLVTGEQVYTISEGRARVNGYGVDLQTSRRLVYPATPDLRAINSEPHVSGTVGAQRINVDRVPINDISEVDITAERTVTVTHGGFVGAMDPLPDTSVLQLMSVSQGATNYTVGVDVRLTAGQVDWSLAGAEPATGSTYSVTYRYITAVLPTAVDDTGFTVTGAVVGSLVMVTYNQKLPRIDRLVMTPEGAFSWVTGVSADYNPRSPSVPNSLLPLASIYQAWGTNSYVSNNSVRVVPMTDLAAINGRIDYMLGLISQQRLESSANLKEAIQKKGLFVDPFLDDTLRDAGIAQTAAVVAGELILPVSLYAVGQMPSDITVETALNHSLAVSIEQPLRTGDMKINPYMAFDPIPAEVTLTPAIDRWTETLTTWASPATRSFVVDNRLVDDAHVSWFGTGLDQYPSTTTSFTSSRLLSQTSSEIENLRQIEVRFEIKGFGANEPLSSVTFDGIPVTPVAI